MGDLHLSTERLHLRPPALADLPFAESLLTDPKVRRYLGGVVPDHSAHKAAQALVTPVAGERIWCACLKASHRAVGLLSLSPHKDGRDIEISYQFAPRYWRQGLASEACAAVIAFGLTDLGLPRIIAETQAANTASIRLLDRLGFAEFDRLSRFGAAQILFECKDRPHS